MGSMKLLIGWRAVRPSLLISFGAIGLVLGTPPDFAMAQSSKAQTEETLDVGDEPGRVSTEELTITDGPFARQAVFFRSTEPPGRSSSIPRSASSTLCRATTVHC